MSTTGVRPLSANAQVEEGILQAESLNDDILNHYKELINILKNSSTNKQSGGSGQGVQADPEVLNAMETIRSLVEKLHDIAENKLKKVSLPIELLESIEKTGEINDFLEKEIKDIEKAEDTDTQDKALKYYELMK